MRILPLIEDDVKILAFIVPDDLYRKVKSGTHLASIVDLDAKIRPTYIEFIDYGFESYRNFRKREIKIVQTNFKNVFLIKISDNLIDKNLVLDIIKII